jgi:hypothetical protein
MVSEEAFFQEEQRRGSDSAADASLDTASSFSETTTDTVTPEPSVVDAASRTQSVGGITDDESGYEQQIQQAIRLSLLEGVNDVGQSPRGQSSGEYEFSITYRSKKGKKGKTSPSSSPSASHTPINGLKAERSTRTTTEDEDLALALSLSLADQEGPAVTALEGIQTYEEFPPLEGEVTGKGKGVQRW